MSVKETLDSVRELYTANLTAHGIDSKSVGWKDAASQEMRFDVLSRVIKEGEPFTVNDFGCGYGAMFEYFKRKYPAINAYNGNDISEPMINKARELHPDGNFLLNDKITTNADYGFVSGTFNVCFKSDLGEWRAWITEMLDMIHETSRKGFAFNLLTSHVDWKAENLFYAPPTEFFDLCKKRYSRFVTLHHDYPLYEWTISVHKDAR